MPSNMLWQHFWQRQLLTYLHVSLAATVADRSCNAAIVLLVIWYAASPAEYYSAQQCVVTAICVAAVFVLLILC
jgi:hypothetical protein